MTTATQSSQASQDVPAVQLNRPLVPQQHAAKLALLLKIAESLITTFLDKGFSVAASGQGLPLTHKKSHAQFRDAQEALHTWLRNSSMGADMAVYYDYLTEYTVQREDRPAHLRGLSHVSATGAFRLRLARGADYYSGFVVPISGESLVLDDTGATIDELCRDHLARHYAEAEAAGLFVSVPAALGDAVALAS